MASKTPAIVVSNVEPTHTIEFVERFQRVERVPKWCEWLFRLARVIDGFCMAHTVIEQTITVLVDGKQVSHDHLTLIDHYGKVARAVDVEMPIASRAEVALYQLGRQHRTQELAGLVVTLPDAPAFCHTANYG